MLNHNILCLGNEITDFQMFKRILSKLHICLLGWFPLVILREIGIIYSNSTCHID